MGLIYTVSKRPGTSEWWLCLGGRRQL